MKLRDIAASSALFGSYLWRAALEKYADATHLTVTLFDADACAVFGPVHPTPLFQLFEEAGYDPGIFAECARRCIAQTKKRPAVLVSQFHGLAVVGASLALEDKIVGAAVGGYAFADFSQVSEIQRLAQQSGIIFERVWEIARKQPPVPQQRLIVHGELLQVLGDALLRENHRTRQYEQAAAIINSSDDAIISEDLSGVITSWNDGAERLYGYSAQEAVGRPITMLTPPDQRQEGPEILAQNVRGESIDHVETVRVRKDGSLLEVSLTISPIRDSAGRVIGASKIARDISERKRELTAMRQLQGVSALLIEGGDTGTLYQKIVDAAVAIMNSDFASMQMFQPERGKRGELQLLASHGFDPQAIKFWERVRADSGCTCGEALRTGRRAIAANVETCDFMAGTDDRTAYLQAGMYAAQSTPLLSRAGRLLGMISTHWRTHHTPTASELDQFDVLARQAADAIERKQAEQRQQLLLNELAHRGRNLLAVIQTIASRSLSGTQSLAEAREAFMQRIQALARSQTMLLRGDFEGAPVADIIRLEFDAFSGRVKVSGPDVVLNPKAAQTFALLAHELATNASKYGALSQPGGRIEISWSIGDKDGEARFNFQWQERGGPPVVPPTRRGFGRTLIEKAAAQDFHAQPNINYAPEGVSYEIDAPLSAVAASAGGTAGS